MFVELFCFILVEISEIELVCDLRTDRPTERRTDRRTDIPSYTVCFFATVTKDDGITRPNDFTPMSAMSKFEVYCMAFVV